MILNSPNHKQVKYFYETGLAQNLLGDDSFGKNDMLDTPIEINPSPVSNSSEQYRELTLNEPIKDTIVNSRSNIS